MLALQDLDERVLELQKSLESGLALLQEGQEEIKDKLEDLEQQVKSGACDINSCAL